MGSRSMRAGISWLVLGALCNDGTETLMDCFERMGVERLMDGRLRAAGLMSTMVGARGGWPTPTTLWMWRSERAMETAREGARKAEKGGRQDRRVRNAAQSWGEPAFICASKCRARSCDQDSGFKSMHRAWWRCRMDDICCRLAELGVVGRSWVRVSSNLMEPPATQASGGRPARDARGVGSGGERYLCQLPNWASSRVPRDAWSQIALKTACAAAARGPLKRWAWHSFSGVCPPSSRRVSAASCSTAPEHQH